jgi:MFS family permease
MIEYAGEDPKKLGTGELTFDSDIEGGPPTWQIALLSTLPILINGIVSFCFVPISIAIGRRPVILLCGALSFIGGSVSCVGRSCPFVKFTARLTNHVSSGLLSAQVCPAISEPGVFKQSVAAPLTL